MRRSKWCKDERMPTMMQAVVVHGPMDYRLEEVLRPEPRVGEVLVKVEAVGICASDVKAYHGAAKFWGDEHRPAWTETDVIPGHEIVGVVSELDDVARRHFGIEVGDRVVPEQIVPDWTCRYCMRGDYHMCKTHNMFGFKRVTPGGMAQYMVLPVEALVHKISKDLRPAWAAFAEPLSCSLHAVERADLHFEDVVVVAGAGPIGLGMVAGAKAKSPALVIAIDTIDAKLEIAKLCGADVTINLLRENAPEIVLGLTGGDGADVYIDGTGNPAAVLQGLTMLRKLGTFVEYSVFKDPVSVDWSILSDDKELDVRGAHLGPHTWPAAIAMIESGRLPMDKICSTELPLASFQEGIDLVGDGTRSVKVSLIPR
jgi:threonine dehydrogenase-like Zn-dependent dehydrogenase